MSTKTAETGIVALVSQIHYFPENNISRLAGTFFDDDADLISLASKLVPGWNNAVGTPYLYNLSDAQIAEAMLQREKQWAEFKVSKKEYIFKIDGKTYNIGYNDVLVEFEKMYCKDGKIVKPKYGGVFGYRRNAALLYANAVRAKMNEESISAITCIVKHYAKLEDTYEDCVAENSLKFEGAKVMNWKDNLTAGKALFETRHNENRFRTLFKAGTGQKLFKFLKLNHTHKEIGLFELAMKDEINVSSMDKEKLNDLIKDQADSATVLDYCKNPKDGKDVPVQIASKKDIFGLWERCPVDIVAYVAACIHGNRVADLDKLNRHADAINKATHGMFVVKKPQPKETPAEVAVK